MKKWESIDIGSLPSPTTSEELARSDLKGKNKMKKPSQQSEDDTITLVRARWIEASERTSQLAAKLFQPGSGYGDPDARAADEHRLQSARLEVERLFREYDDLDRRNRESKVLELQRSQMRATWASFSVAVVAAIIALIALFK